MAESAGTVLVFDDTPQTARRIEKMMRTRPFKILAAPRPSEALRIFERESVHLLISDIAMPEMDGNKLAEKVLALYPDTRILLIWGNSKEEPPAATTGRVKFLKKPFFPSDLLEALRELLPDL